MSDTLKFRRDEDNSMIDSRRDDIVLKTLMNDKFMEFIEEQREPYQELLAYYRCAIMEMETKFRVLNEQFSLQYDRNPIESIKSRIKSMDSLLKKIKVKNVNLTLQDIENQITDIAGVRVVCSFPEDIYLLYDCLAKQDDIKVLEVKDYIKNPKPSGYRSLHLIVEIPIFLRNEKRNMKVEVQLRTIAMDFWASLEHKLRYKKDIPEDILRGLSKELSECAETIARLDYKMQMIRNELSPEEHVWKLPTLY